MSQFRPTRLESVRSGEVHHGMWLMSDSADLARIASSVGYGYVCIDMQHGFARAGDLVRLSDAIRSGGEALVTVRVPENDFTQLGMAADAGAEAIIVPLIDSVDDARRAVSALRYPDAGGTRSWGPANALMMGDPGEDPAIRPLLLLMIETAEALANVEEIAALEGVDGLYIGPSDLAFAVGSRPGPEEQATTEAIASILAATREHGKIAACHTGGGAEAHARREQGFTFITTAADVAAARTAFGAELSAGRGER
ncbi:HpcH/HpaI aldolase family protein [Brevibacterium album]|uniref:HpcH/HpaI aldolase family protein n=1 Tax=Brevibacterium album TaxID=417948 RepID=UPI00041F87B3|nr:aldolase/citrate lyase family protein [Brevibacterium album]